MNLGCHHPRTSLMRVIGRGGIVHVADVCLICGGNARGVGRWVPRDSIGRPVEDLPIWKDLRTPEEKGEQPTLFS